MPRKITPGKTPRISDHEAIKEAIHAKEAAQAATARADQLKQENALLHKERLAAVKQLETYLQIAESVPLFKLTHKAGKTDSLSVPVFLFSDWHIEEEIRPQQVRGKNEFNLEIADQRIQRLGNKAVEYALSRKSETDIPEVVVWLGGDFMSGYIHEELMTINQLSPPDAIIWVKSRISAILRHIASNFPKVRVVCNVGNHGRTTHKRWMHNGQRNSYEWLMYHVIADEMKASGVQNIEFFIPESYFAEFSVFETAVRTHHGDNVMYGGGVGGPSIPINKAIAAWDVAEQVDIDYFGHLHTFIDHHRWCMNGSLIGYSPYSVAIKAKYQRPLQVVDFIHHRVGRTDTIKVYLD